MCTSCKHLKKPKNFTFETLGISGAPSYGGVLFNCKLNIEFKRELCLSLSLSYVPTNNLFYEKHTNPVGVFEVEPSLHLTCL